MNIHYVPFDDRLARAKALTQSPKNSTIVLLITIEKSNRQGRKVFDLDHVAGPD